MGEHGAICRLGVFCDGSFFSYAQHYYYHERQLGWLRFPELFASQSCTLPREVHGVTRAGLC
jgi:hypothetical protein